MTITKYVLVDKDNREGDWEYDSMQDAIDDAVDEAVIERKYEFADSELVWTPDGSKRWPPQPVTQTTS